MFKEMLENVRQVRPLIHNITNYVTVNDCADVLLASGSSPIMADDINEVEDITSICGGLNINIGTLNRRTIPAMIAAGKKANELEKPVVLDPVGVGASRLRSKTVNDLIEHISFTTIRSNSSEIKAIAFGQGSTRGVDADIADSITKDTFEQFVLLAKELAKRMKTIIAITGFIDIVADSEQAYVIYNGHEMMSSITGTGCQLSALITAYLTANPNKPLEATAAAVCAMGICGEKAKARLKEEEGNATYRNYIIDEIYKISGEELEGCARYKIY